MLITQARVALYLEDLGYEVYTDGLIDNHKIKKGAEELGGIYDPVETKWDMPFNSDFILGKDNVFTITKEDIVTVLDSFYPYKDMKLDEQNKIKFINVIYEEARKHYEIDWEDFSNFIEEYANVAISRFQWADETSNI